MSEEYEKRVLAATPAKALTFLRASAMRGDIRAELFAVGYTPEEQALGWRLLQDASQVAPGGYSPANDAAAREAIAKVDAFDEPGFSRVDAALERHHPQQRDYVFDGLQATRGAGSLLTVTLMLDRLDTLESGTGRGETREEDQAAIATLAARGITSEVRAELRRLIEIGQAASPVNDNPAVEERQAALLQLRAWYKDWARTARAVITRKDYLIMLGLSKRNVTDGGGKEVVEEVPETESPSPDPILTAQS